MLSNFDHGVLWGFERYSVELCCVGTFGMPRLVGELACCALRSDFNDGVLHGLALGAVLHLRRQLITAEGRTA